MKKIHLKLLTSPGLIGIPVGRGEGWGGVDSCIVSHSRLFFSNLSPLSEMWWKRLYTPFRRIEVVFLQQQRLWI